MSKRILIITDSISMPRIGTPYEKTWIYHFKKKFSSFDVIDRPMRGATSSRLVFEGGGGIDLLELYNPDIVIIQFGLAECAPRLFKKRGFEYFFMQRILPKRYLSNYIDFVKKRRVRNPEYTEIEHSVTVNNIRSYIERCDKRGTKVILFKINRPNDYYIAKSPFIGRNTERFNKMLETFANEYGFITLADPFREVDNTNSLYIDELHVNAEGHMIYFREITEIIARISV